MDTRLTSIFLSMTLIMGLNSFEKESDISLITKIFLFIFLIIDQVIYFHANKIFIDNKILLQFQKPLEKVIDLFLGTFVMITALFWAKYIYYPLFYFTFFFLANLFGSLWWYLFSERCKRYNKESEHQNLLKSILNRFIVLHIVSLIISLLAFIFINLIYLIPILDENKISIFSVSILFFSYLVIIITKYDDIFKLLDLSSTSEMNQ